MASRLIREWDISPSKSALSTEKHKLLLESNSPLSHLPFSHLPSFSHLPLPPQFPRAFVEKEHDVLHSLKEIVDIPSVRPP